MTAHYRISGLLKRVPEHAWRGRDTKPDYRAAVNKLTNHQRNLWARAGYPGAQDMEAFRVELFLEHRK